MLLLYQLVDSAPDSGWKNQVVKLSARCDFGNDFSASRRSVAGHRGGRRTSVGAAVALDEVGKTVGEDVVAFRTFLGDDGFGRHAEAAPVTSCASLDEREKEITASHTNPHGCCDGVSR